MKWLLLAFLPLLASAADWPNIGYHNNTQPNETLLTTASVKDLVVIWHKHLGGTLSSPVILGRVITHRGFQELVIVSSSNDTVTSIDGDLGRILWQRKLDDLPTANAKPVAPAFRPIEPDSDDDDDDDDGPPPRQPLIALSSTGRLFALKTLSGADELVSAPLEAPGALGLRVSATGIAPVSQLSYKASDGASQYIAEKSQLTAFVSDRQLWSSPIHALTPPILANGLLFVLASDAARNQLLVIDAATGNKLKSIPIDGDIPTGSALALANGHIAFTTAAGDVYCLGLPIDL